MSHVLSKAALILGLGLVGCHSSKPPSPPLEPEYKSASFYDHRIQMPTHDALPLVPEGSLSGESIRRYLLEASSAVPDEILNILERKRSELDLNGWTFTELTRELGRTLYPENSNAQTLFSCYALREAGYDVRLGHNATDMYLMVASDDVVYELPQMRMGGQRYYILQDERGKDFGSLEIHEGPYTEAQSLVDFTIPHTPYLSDTTHSRTITFDFRDTKHEINVEYLLGSLNFLETYNRVPFDTYFQAGASKVATESLEREFESLLDSLGARESVNLLLRFVQRGFDYELDEEVFGEDRWLYPEETLYYPYADCEDRAFLFAYLVRELLELQVVGLRYPSHVATAVRLEDGTGESVYHDGEEYYLADPTYFGADVGMVMSMVEGEEPRVIPIGND